MSRRIWAACMTQNELSDLIPNVESLLPYVDGLVCVDGGSTDLTIPYMRNWEKEEPKIKFYIHPWADNFSGQRNNYLKHVAEVAQEGDWLLTFDADEYFMPDTLAKLHKAADRAERDGLNMVGFQCRSVSLNGSKRVWESLDEYWKHLFIRWDPKFHYVGNPHEGKAGIPHNIMNTSLLYEHRKQSDITWLRGMRNSFIGGSGDNLMHSCPLWVRARKTIKDATGIDDWHSFYKYLLKGNIHSEIKQFMVDVMFEGRSNAGPNCWRNYDWPGSSEWREWYKTYFRIFHKEEEPEEFRSVHID